jgi:hypothetical protein
LGLRQGFLDLSVDGGLEEAVGDELGEWIGHREGMGSIAIVSR